MLRCASPKMEFETSEMTHDDYTKSTFFDICKESDRVVIMRPDLSQQEIDEAVFKCKSFQGAEYDASFDLGVKSLYCSELIYQSYQGNSLGVLKILLVLTTIHQSNRIISCKIWKSSQIATNYNLLRQKRQQTHNPKSKYRHQQAFLFLLLVFFFLLSTLFSFFALTF